MIDDLSPKDLSKPLAGTPEQLAGEEHDDTTAHTDGTIHVDGDAHWDDC